MLPTPASGMTTPNYISSVQMLYPNLLLPRPIYQPQNMLNAAQIFGIVYCKSSLSLLQSQSQLTSTLATQLNVLSTPAAKLEISIHAPQCHFRECASSWQNFFFLQQAFVCSTEKRLICVLQETASNMADYEVLRSLLHSSLPLTYLLSLCECGRVGLAGETSSKLPEFKLQVLRECYGATFSYKSLIMTLFCIL